MLACLDVDYRAQDAVAGCVVFRAWTDAAPAAEHAAHFAPGADYESGELYKRELPGLLAVLAMVTDPLEVIVVDGNTWLDAARTRPGLGAHLHQALGGAVPIIGVAKNPFAGSSALQVRRGTSARPLYVTAAGIDERIAAAHIASMHGPHRLPTLLKRVDRLARDAP